MTMLMLKQSRRVLLSAGWPVASIL